MAAKNFTRLTQAMERMDLSARELSRACGISYSLIARLQSGQRPLTRRGRSLDILADALARLDGDGRLDDILAPWRTAGQSKAEALREYLAGQDVPTMPGRVAPPALQYSGEYLVQQQVLLGAKGFQRTAFLMLDYVLRLPPGQEILICAHGGFDLWHMHPGFAAGFMEKVMEAAGRGTRVTLINRDIPAVVGSAWLSAYWLSAHMRGFLRTVYYQGEAPPELFTACIPGYWGGTAERDDTAEDGLLITLCSDPRFVQRREAHVLRYLAKSRQGVQYGFLQNPTGGDETPRRWQPGPLPVVPVGEQDGEPDGGFDAICRVPLFGIMTKEEWQRVRGKKAAPPLPDYLFPEGEAFAGAPHRIILCREDLREGLAKGRRQSHTLSGLLGHPVNISRQLLAEQLRRLLAEMRRNKGFRVALVPRSAFQKLGIEFTHWNSSAAVGWPQEAGDSMFACDAAYCVSFTTAMDYIWDRLRPGWKSYRRVSEALRGWLEGEGLDTPFEDSSVVRNWELLPRE